jgi:hypothetical protein
MYATFGDRQTGNPFPTEKEVREAALIEGLVIDVPVADEESGQVITAGYHVEHVADV